MVPLPLPPNCAAGLDAPAASPAEVAKYTTRTMLRCIPPAVPGIHFLSGGWLAGWLGWAG